MEINVCNTLSQHGFVWKYGIVYPITFIMMCSPFEWFLHKPKSLLIYVDMLQYIAHKIYHHDIPFNSRFWWFILGYTWGCRNMSGYISPILTIVIVGSQLVGTYYHNCNQYASLFIPTGWIYPISPYYPHIIPIFSPYYPHIIPILSPYSWLNYTIIAVNNPHPCATPKWPLQLRWLRKQPCLGWLMSWHAR